MRQLILICCSAVVGTEHNWLLGAAHKDVLKALKVTVQVAFINQCKNNRMMSVGDNATACDVEARVTCHGMGSMFTCEPDAHLVVGSGCLVVGSGCSMVGGGCLVVDSGFWVIGGGGGGGGAPARSSRTVSTLVVQLGPT